MPTIRPTLSSPPINAASTDDGVPAVSGTSVRILGDPGAFGGGTGVWGTSGTGVGVHGDSRTGDGVIGISNKNGVHGVSSSASDSGVWGENDRKGYGVSGSTNSDFQPSPAITAGVWGSNAGGGAGVKGTSQAGDGVVGFSSASGHAGVSANNTVGGYGLWAQGTPAGHFEGNVEVNGTLTVIVDVVLSGADFAEDFAVETIECVEPGTVMVLDENGVLRPCNKSYDRKVAGVISGAGDYRPGLILDRQKSSEGRLPIALVGKVYCKVDATYGAIEVGDLLTTSSTLGHAMRASDPVKAFGSVLGKALRPLYTAKGLLPVLVSLQ